MVYAGSGRRTIDDDGSLHKWQGKEALICAVGLGTHLGTIVPAGPASFPRSFCDSLPVQGPAANTTSVAGIETWVPSSFVVTTAVGVFESAANSRPDAVAMWTLTPRDWALSIKACVR